ncbi:MAG: hypothetical protein ACK4UN_16465 [Limisphaerales bacterium]
MRSLLLCILLFVGSGQAPGICTNSPATLADFAAMYPEPPAGENAAELFQKAASLLVMDDAYKDEHLMPWLAGKAPVPNQPLPPAMSNKLAAVVDRNQEAMEWFSKAVKLKQSRYPIDWSKGAEAELPHLSRTCLHSSQFIRWSALRHAARGNEAAAVESVLVGFALATSLDMEPVLISQNVRATCIRRSADGLNQVFNRVRLTEESLRKLRDVVNQLERCGTTGDRYCRALAGEKVFIRNFFELPLEKRMELLMWQQKFERPFDELRKQVVAQHSADRSFLMETWEQMIRLWSKPYPERLKAETFASSAYQRALDKSLPVSSSWLHFSIRGEAKSLAMLRLMQAAIALEQYRNDHHNLYPQFLSHLTPKYLESVPIDPFDGKPLRYRKLGRGYAMYSIGTNQSERVRSDLRFDVVEAPR